jgi:hypothetical protein
LWNNKFKKVKFMTSNSPQDNRQDESRYDPQDNPGTQTNIPTTEEGDTPLDERYRMTSQQSGSEVSAGAEPESPGASPNVIGSPNQGTDSR